MPELMPVQMLVDMLEQIRSTHGQAAYEKARYDIAFGIILKPNGEAFLQNAFPGFDLEPARAAATEAARKAAEAQPMPQADEAQTPEAALFNMIRQQMPNLKTQAHFNTFLAAFDALRTTLDGYFTGDTARATRAREALNKVLDMAPKVTLMAEQAAEVPPEERSKTMSEYVDPPKQFHEFDDQRQLMLELAGLTTLDGLNDWYAATREKRERIDSQKLRNELFDAIRKKRLELTKSEAN